MMNINNTPANGDFASYIENLTNPTDSSSTNDPVGWQTLLTRHSVPTVPAAPSTTPPTDSIDQAALLRKAFAPIVPLSLGAFILASVASFLDSPYALCARLSALLIGLHVVRLIVTHLSLVRHRLKEHVTQSLVDYNKKMLSPFKFNSKK